MPNFSQTCKTRLSSPVRAALALFLCLVFFSFPAAGRAQGGRLEIGPTDIVVGPRGGGLYIMIDLFPYYSNLSGQAPDQIKTTLIETAKHYSAAYLAEKKFQKIDQARVAFISVLSRDEYGQKDFGSLVKHGWLLLKKSGRDLAVTEDKLDLGSINLKASGDKGGASAPDQSSSKPAEKKAVASSPNAQAPKDFAEQIIFDEMDFYDHPAYLANTYPPFTPERVRKINAEYYFRYDPKGREKDISGVRYGEIVLREDGGSVLYLPRDLDLNQLEGVSFLYRKTDPEARVFFSIYKTLTSKAVVKEGGSPSFPAAQDTDWHQVVIPFSELKFAEHPSPLEKAERWGPWANLKFYQVSEGRVYGLEFGMTGSAEGRSFFLDRLTFLRPGPGSRVLNGSVEPATADLDIFIDTPQKRYAVKTDGQGKFRFEIPREVSRLDLSTRYKDLWYLPTMGRDLEVGSHVSAVKFILKNEKPAKFAGRENNYDYLWTEDRGVVYQEKAYFLTVQGYDDKDQDFFTEFGSNSFGYVDRDRRYDNPDGVKRVVLIGACYTDGLQVSSQDRINIQIEEMFRFRSKPIEVISASNTWHGLQGGWAVFKNYGLNFKPDLLIINILRPSQLRSLHLEYEAYDWKFHPDHPKKDFFQWDKKQKKLIHIPYDPDWRLYAADLPKFKDPSYYANYGGVNWVNDFYRVDHSKAPAFFQETRKLLVEILKVFVKEGQKTGCKVAIALSDFIPPRTFTENGVDYDTSQVHAFFRGAAKEAGAYYIDATRVFQEKNAKTNEHWVHMWTLGHWSPAGHRFAAEALADGIEKILHSK